MWSGCFVASALLWTASVALAQELGDGGRLRAAMGQPRPFERPLPAIAERAAPAPERQAAPPTPAAKPLPTVVAASALVVPAQEGPQQHKRAVLRLRAIPAVSAAETLQKFLRAEGQAYAKPGAQSVGIAGDPVSNTLLVGGPADAVEQVLKLVEQIDRPAAMVLVEVVIGEAPIEPSGSAKGRPEAGRRETLRLMEKPDRMEVTARAQLATVDGQEAYFQIGRTEPTITGTVTSTLTGGYSNTLTYRNVGTIVKFVPRVGADGRIAMDIDLSASGMGPVGEGKVITMPKSGEPLRAPTIEQMMAQTTLCVPSGQTVVLRGHTKSPAASKELVVLITPHVLRMDGSVSPR